MAFSILPLGKYFYNMELKLFFKIHAQLSFIFMIISPKNYGFLKMSITYTYLNHIVAKQFSNNFYCNKKRC